MEAIKGQELILGGIVTGAEHRMTKNGKPFGTLDFEDYDGNYKFFLFGDDYIKNKGYLSEGFFLCVRGRVQERKRWKDDQPIELEFKIFSIELLSELKEKTTKGIKINIHLEDLSPQMIDDIEKLVIDFKGDKDLKLRLKDGENKIDLDMLSRKYRVDPSQEFFEKMDGMVGIDYQLY